MTCSDYTDSGGYFFLRRPFPFILEGVAVVIPFEEVWGMDVLGRFPGVVTFGVPFPLHEVLEHSRLPMTSVVDQVFYLVFFGPLNQVRWGSREVGAMHGGSV